MGRLRQLDPAWYEDAYAYCEQVPERAVFVAGWLHEGGLSQSKRVPKGWVLAELSGEQRVTGLLYLSMTGILMPVFQSPQVAEHVATIGRANPGMVRVLVGERTVVDEIWRALTRLQFSARLVRDQVLYAVSRDAFSPADGPLPLSIAEERDLDRVVAASAAMAREEANDDPQARNPSLFRERILDRVRRGRDFMHVDDDELVFKANIAALSPLGGQIEGVYTNPARRRRGYGARGTSTITQWVLESSARAVLLVNEDNAPARRIYEELGYRAVYESRTIFVAP